MKDLWKLLTLFAVGAILYNVISNPKGTRALGRSLEGILGTGLSYSARGKPHR
jgi:hypothetical protein